MAGKSNCACWGGWWGGGGGVVVLVVKFCAVVSVVPYGKRRIKHANAKAEADPRGEGGGRGGRAPSPQKFQPCFFAAWHAVHA